MTYGRYIALPYMIVTWGVRLPPGSLGCHLQSLPVNQPPSEASSLFSLGSPRFGGYPNSAEVIRHQAHGSADPL